MLNTTRNSPVLLFDGSLVIVGSVDGDSEAVGCEIEGTDDGEEHRQIVGRILESDTQPVILNKPL